VTETALSHSLVAMPQHKNPSDLPGAKYLLFSFVQLTKIEFTSFGFNTLILKTCTFYQVFTHPLHDS